MGSVERGVYVGKRDCKGEVLSREREGHFQMSQCVQGRAGVGFALVQRWRKGEMKLGARARGSEGVL